MRQDTDEASDISFVAGKVEAARCHGEDALRAIMPLIQAAEDDAKDAAQAAVQSLRKLLQDHAALATHLRKLLQEEEDPSARV